MGREQSGGVRTCRNKQGPLVLDHRSPKEELGIYCQSSRQTLKVRAALGGSPGCVLPKGAYKWGSGGAPLTKLWAVQGLCLPGRGAFFSF